MPYREGIHAGAAACHKHAAAPAAAACTRCAQPICEICLSFAGARPYCYPCAAKARRQARIATALQVLGVLCVIGIVVAAILHRAAQFDTTIRNAPPPSPGPTVADFRRDYLNSLRARISLDRCNQRTTIDYADALIKDEQSKDALDDLAAYLERCPDFYLVHWRAYTAHQALGEHLEAATEAGRLMAFEPEDSDYRWWRGFAYEGAGHFDEAIADYRAAIRLNPEITNIPLNLAALLEKKGARCEALSVVRTFLRRYPDSADDDEVEELLTRLSAGGACKGSPRR